MKRFYIAVLLFMLPIFVFVGGAECFVRRQPNIYRYKNDWMDQHAEEVETLIIGNSFAMNGVIPDSLRHNAFNLALGGEPLKYDHFLFFKWANRYKNLKMVIQSVAYDSFYQGCSDFVVDDIQETTYKLYMGCQKHSDFSFYSLESRHSKVFLEKLKRYLTNKYDYSEAYCGWQCGTDFSAELAPTFDRENKKYARIQTVDSYENADNNVKLLEEELSFCIKHNVRFVIISPPHWKSWNSLLSPRQITKNRELIQSLQKKYSFVYLDYREDKRFVESDFSDRMHLTKSGAEKFSKILAKDVLVK